MLEHPFFMTFIESLFSSIFMTSLFFLTDNADFVLQGEYRLLMLSIGIALIFVNDYVGKLLYNKEARYAKIFKSYMQAKTIDSFPAFFSSLLTEAKKILHSYLMVNWRLYLKVLLLLDMHLNH